MLSLTKVVREMNEITMLL